MDRVLASAKWLSDRTRERRVLYRGNGVLYTTTSSLCKSTACVDAFAGWEVLSCPHSSGCRPTGGWVTADDAACTAVLLVIRTSIIDPNHDAGHRIVEAPFRFWPYCCYDYRHYYGPTQRHPYWCGLPKETSARNTAEKQKQTNGINVQGHGHGSRTEHDSARCARADGLFWAVARAGVLAGQPETETGTVP